MKLEDIYKKIDALNEAVSMNISMSGDNAQDVGDLFNMMRGEQPKAEPIKIAINAFFIIILQKCAGLSLLKHDVRCD